MPKRIILAAVLTLAATPVFAQEAPYSRTLDEQLQRVKEGKPAVPMAAGKATVSSGKSHKASPLAPTPVHVDAAPTANLPIAYDKYGQPIQSVGGGAIPSLPLTEMISGEIYFITGGVGDEEIDQMKSVADAYNFHLLITATGGEYLSGATLRLRDAKGVDVLATGGAGPYFYARLKPGSYTLDVTTAMGATQSVPVKVMPNVVLKKTVQFNV